MEQITTFRRRDENIDCEWGHISWMSWLDYEGTRLEMTGLWRGVRVQAAGPRLALYGEYVGPEMAERDLGGKDRS